MRCGLACAAAFGTKPEVAAAPNASAPPIRRSRRLRRGSCGRPQLQSENQLREGMAVMMVPPFSVRLEAGLLDHAGPHGDIGFQPRLEFLRREGRGLAAELDHACLEVGVV